MVRLPMPLMRLLTSPTLRILHGLYDLPEIVASYPDIAVADQDVRKLRDLIGGNEVVDLGIKGVIPLFYHDGDLLTGIQLLYLSCKFHGRIIFFFEGEYDLIVWVVLVAEAREISKEVVIQAP